MKESFWEKISGMRPEWQIELVSKLLPDLEKGRDSGGKGSWLVRSTPTFNLNNVADAFNPK
jgi:hypothetical protein